MRILHVVPEMVVGCGVSNSVYSAVEAMHQKGHKLFIVASLLDDVNRKKLLKLNVPFFIAPLSQNKKNISFFLKSFKIISKIIKDHNIQIIHSHHRWNCLIATICARLNHAVSLTSDHNILFGKRILSFWADGLITDSTYNRDYLSKYFKVPEKKIKIVAPIIEKERYDKLMSINFSERSEFGQYKTKSTLLVGQIARLSEEKGQLFFLDVIRKVVDNFLNIKFLFLGDGPLKEVLAKRVKELNLSDHVYFLGRHENICDFLSVLDFFVVSSSREGFCMSATEAILSGLPIVATKVGGLLEQIRDGETGFLVEYGDKIGLQEKIEWLVLNHQKMRGKGREYLLSKYSYEILAEKLEAAYKYFLR